MMQLFDVPEAARLCLGGQTDGSLWTWASR